MKLADLTPETREWVADMRDRGSLMLELLIDHCLAEAGSEQQLIERLEGGVRALHEEATICLNGVINFRNRRAKRA